MGRQRRPGWYACPYRALQVSANKRQHQCIVGGHCNSTLANYGKRGEPVILSIPLPTWTISALRVEPLRRERSWGALPAFERGVDERIRQG